MGNLNKIETTRLYQKNVAISDEIKMVYMDDHRPYKKYMDTRKTPKGMKNYGGTALLEHSLLTYR